MRLYPVIIFLSAAVVLGVAACGAFGSGGEAMEVTVGPELEDCVGVAPMKCMVVNDELFYDTIAGFDYEPGYEYRLKIERYDAWPDREEPPQDAGKYGYRLMEVIEKMKVAP